MEPTDRLHFLLGSFVSEQRLASPPRNAPATAPPYSRAVSRRASAEGLVIIWVWREEGSPTPLRAQVRYMAEVSAGVEVTQTFTDIDAAMATVRAWLTEAASSP